MDARTLLAAWMPLALAGMLVWAGVEDARRRTIANAKNAGIALAAPLWWWAAELGLWPDVGVQLAMGLVALFAFALAFRAGMMGGGDVKMIAALALWFPWSRFAGLLVAMSLIGGAVTLLMVAGRRRGTDVRQVEVPYGVAIAAAGLLSLHEPLLNQFG